MKVLFTTQWYKIDSTISNSANSLCINNVIEELKKRNSYEIHVLSYGLKGYPISEIVEGVHIHRFKRSFFWDMYIKSRIVPERSFSKLLHFLYRISLRIKQFLYIPLFPIYEPLHVLHFARCAYVLQRKEQFDLVVSDHFGTDSLYAGYYIKKRCPEVSYLPICWDSIAGGNLPKYLPRALALKKKKIFETKIASLAEKMIVMDASKAFHYSNERARDYLDKLVFLDVPFFIPSVFNSITTINHERLNVVFAGNMTGRDPSYLLDLFERFSMPSTFTFICHRMFHNNLLRIGSKYKNVCVKCLPYMNHDDLMNFQCGADILVNFGVKNPSAISGKIFDYMSTGRAIISTTTIDNEACIPYLEKYGKALIIDERDTITDSLISLKRFIREELSRDVSLTVLKKTFYANTPDAYCCVIDKLLDR